MWIVDNHYTIYKENKAVQERVIIVKKEDYSVITETIEGDFSSATDTELITEVLEVFYQKIYMNRAEKEEIQKLKKINQEQSKQLEKSEDLLTKTNLAMFEMTDKVLTNEEKLDYLYRHLKVEFVAEESEETVEKEEVTEHTETESTEERNTSETTETSEKVSEPETAVEPEKVGDGHAGSSTEATV